MPKFSQIQSLKSKEIKIEKVKNFFQSLDQKIPAQKDDIKTKLLKNNVYFARYTSEDINYSICF